MVQVIARAIIENNGRYLAVKNKGQDFWCLPGGKVDDTEDIKEALKRELVEELGVVPNIGRLMYVHQFINEAKQKQRLEFLFEVTNSQDYSTADFMATTHGAAELDAAEFIGLKDDKLLPDFLADELPLTNTEAQFRVRYSEPSRNL